MPAALFHAILCVVFLAVYVLAGEVLVGARRRRRVRMFRADGPETAHLDWHRRDATLARHG